MKIDLSIIVPIYNIENYLKQAVESLLNQIRYNYEIILVNDGSTDSCLEICKKYKMFTNIKVINKANGGLVSARKAGVMASEGDYITFLDGDDWIDKAYYYNMLYTAKKYDADVVCSGYIEYNDGKCIENKNSIKSGEYSGENLNLLYKKLLYKEPYYTFGVIPSVWSKIFKKNILTEFIMKIPEKITIGEDVACTFPVLFNCNKIVILNNNTGYYYRQSQSSMTRVYSADRIKQILCVINYINSSIEKNMDYDIQKEMYFSFLIKYIIKFEALSLNTKNEKVDHLKYLCGNKIIQNTIYDVCRSSISFKYKFLYLLLKYKKYNIVIYYYKCCYFILKHIYKK